MTTNKINPWVIEYSFFYEAFGVLQMDEYLKKAHFNYARQQLHPYIILGVFATREEASAACSKMQEFRNENMLSYDYRANEFEKAANSLKERAKLDQNSAENC